MVRILFTGIDDRVDPFPSLIGQEHGFNKHNGVPKEVEAALSDYYTTELVDSLKKKFTEKDISSFSEFCQYMIASQTITNEGLEKILTTPGFQVNLLLKNWNNTPWMVAFVRLLKNDASKIGIETEKSLLPFTWINFIKKLSIYFGLEDK